MPKAATAEKPQYEREISFLDFKLNFYTFPLVFAAGFLTHSINVGSLIIFYFFLTPIHEMGHALFSWLGSRVAIPIGAFIPMAAFTYRSESRSIFLFFILLGFSLWIINTAALKKKWFVAFLSCLFSVALSFITFFVSEQTRICLFDFGGMAGQFLISTLFIIGFYHPLSHRLRWDFFRFPFLIAGAFTYIDTFSMWIKISRFQAAIPFGSFLNGESDQNGDMNKLMNNHHWTVPDIIHTYLNIGKACSIFILAHYFIYLFVSFRQKTDSDL